jgi:putative transcriptional regulator
MSENSNIEKGDILLAQPFLKDPNFKRKVILVCEHNEEGSFGLVLNNRLDYKINDILEFPQFNADIYQGGPVSLDTLHFIHRYGELIEGAVRLKGNLFWSGNYDQVKMLAEQRLIDPSGIRFFVGYSGWGAGQLATEMEEKSWIVAKNFDKVLTPEMELWKRVLYTLGGEYPLMANYPEDPILN